MEIVTCIHCEARVELSRDAAGYWRSFNEELRRKGEEPHLRRRRRRSLVGMTSFDKDTWPEEDTEMEWEEMPTKIVDGSPYHRCLNLLLELYEHASFEMGRTWTTREAQETLREAGAYIAECEEKGLIE